MANNENSRRAVLHGRFRFLNIWEAVSVNGSEPRYNVGLLVDKSETENVEQMKKCYEAARESYKSKYGEIDEEKFRNPIKDGDKEEDGDESFRGCYFINANCKYSAPEVVDYKVEKISDRNLIKIGDYGYVSVTFYPYCTKDAQGVAILLGNVQWEKKGAPIYERSTAADDFNVIEKEEDILG